MPALDDDREEMLAKPTISVDEVKKLLRLDEDTGRLMWRERAPEMFVSPKNAASWNAKYANREAFTAAHGTGYRVGRIAKRNYFAHRVVWAIHHGKWPDNQIDHINGDRGDNRPANLRDVSNAENHRNVRQRQNNSTGITGVYWHRQIFKWVANIAVDGKTRYLGVFASKNEAAEAYETAKVAHGYHPNHGSIGRAA